MIEMESSLRNQCIGIFLVVVSFLCVAIMNALAKQALHFASLGDILFMQNFWAFLCVVPFCLQYAKKLSVQYWKMHLLRAFAGLLSYLCLFLAVQYIPLVDATLLGNSAPLFLPFVAWAWIGQKISLSLWLSLIIGFLGVVLIVNPKEQSSINVWMVLIALLGSLFSALALQAVRSLGRKEPAVLIALYYFLIASLVLIPFFSWSQFSFHEWMFLIAIGASLALIQVLLAVAYKYASPTLLGPFNYTVVVFAGLIDWFFWDVIPGFLSILGILFIVFGGVLSLRQQRKEMA